jgi:hypothetical protein
MTQKIMYAVDIVLCIDATASMANSIERIKSGARTFYHEITTKMSAKDKVIDELRVRVVVFRDFWVDGKEALKSSTFFVLPAEQEEFCTWMSTIHASGGGDEPENGLDAIATAITSDWSTSAERRRQTIVVFTDAPAHPLEKEPKRFRYPVNMPKNFDELTDLYEDRQGHMNHSAKRIVLFAPEASPWNVIGSNWNQAVVYPTKAGDGLSDMDYGTIIELLSNSI